MRLAAWVKTSTGYGWIGQPRPGLGGSERAGVPACRCPAGIACSAGARARCRRRKDDRVVSEAGRLEFIELVLYLPIAPRDPISLPSPVGAVRNLLIEDSERLVWFGAILIARNLVMSAGVFPWACILIQAADQCF